MIHSAGNFIKCVCCTWIITLTTFVAVALPTKRLSKILDAYIFEQQYGKHIIGRSTNALE